MGVKEFKPDDFLYNRQGPWPQPCPEHPFTEAAGVIHIPQDEVVDWWLHIGSRYLRTLFYTPIAFFRGLWKPGLEEISDEEFSQILTRSLFSKFLKKNFEAKDHEIFGEFINASNVWVCDFSPIKVFKPFKNLYVSATKVLFRLEGERFAVISIYVEATNSLFTPQDGDKWELAKYFALQSVALCSTLVMHPLVHFPMDSINAITKSALPKNHLLFQLVYPHLRFTLYLEKAVLTFKSSILQSKWWIPYAPYPGPYESVRKLLAQGYRGIEDNKNYVPFKYLFSPPVVIGKYGEFQQAYYAVIKTFVENILVDLDETEVFYLAKWGDYINPWVPGFPTGKELVRDRELLSKTVAFFIYDVSVAHTVDHYNFGRMNFRKIPLRLRVPPPDHKKDYKLKRSKLTKFWDFGKIEMARRIFYVVSTKTKLIDTIYDFGEKNEKLQKHVLEFKENMRAVDRRLNQANACFVPLEDIAESIQF